MMGRAVLPPGGLRVAVQELTEYDERVNYDPAAFYDPELANVIPDAEWSTVVSAEHQAEGELLLHTDTGRELLLRGTPIPGGVGLDLLPPEDSVLVWVSASVESDGTEPLWGLGESFDDVNQRGHVRAMQIELDQELESSYNEAHVPVPFVLGGGGWGFGAQTDWPAVVDAASTDSTRVTMIVHAPEGLSLGLFSAEDGQPGRAVEDLVAAWSQWTGLPRVPPDWAFGPMQWRNEVSGEGDLLADAAATRDQDLAFSVMWVDNPWQTTYNSMIPDPGMFPQWEAMMDTLHDAGFRFLAWTTPYLEDSDPEHDAWESEGSFVDLPIGFNQFGDLLDLTVDPGLGHWSARVEAARALGIEGWKLDYGEDLQLGYGELRLTAHLGNGRDERTMHHRYAEAYHNAYSLAYGEEDRFLLGRAGAWGTPSLTDCIWPGDLDSDFRTHREDGHVGGLPAAIRAGVSLSLSGFPCFASDTGGFRHERPTAEVMIRWTEMSALLPFMQVGGGGADHNYWRLEEGWGPSVLEAGRRYTQLHTRLFPTFRRLLQDAHDTGRPPLLPAQAIGGGADDAVFVVGRTMLVAPVEVAGATTRNVTLPPGAWIHWWTGERYEGDVTIPAPLGEGPLLRAEGAIIPMLRDTVRTLAPTDGSVDSWADDPGALVVRVVPGDGEFVVVDGPVMQLIAGGMTVGPLGRYTGIEVEVWAPESLGITLDGEEVPTVQDGPWRRAVVGTGIVGW